MKIKTANLSYEQVKALPTFEHQKPEEQSPFFRWLLKQLSASELKKVNFTCEKIQMDRLHKDEPCLILMNHSSFIDLKIAATLLCDRPYHIVCTYDGFVGKEWLMRKLGCIPTRKFNMDVLLVKDMVHIVKNLKSSVLMYPEASYSFDGTETPLPDSLGKCLKLLKVPVVMIRTEGAFTRDPLYNNLQIRNVNVKATMEYLFSPEDIKEKNVEELNRILKEHFSYDHFKWQQDNKISITEPFRADCLNRVLYKCSSCQREGDMEGKGTTLTCKSCGKTWELTEYGYMKATEGPTEFSHIPDWYRWERECVREELLQKNYHLQLDVSIYMMVNTKCVYHVGDGILIHTENGFTLDGCDGQLHYEQGPKTSYSLYSDYYWYEIGDMICIGNEKAQYYCFPKTTQDIVAKTRLATEELYKMVK